MKAIQHRLSNYESYDNIMVLDQGAVAEFGPPADLLAKKSVFYRMVNAK